MDDDRVGELLKEISDEIAVLDDIATKLNYAREVLVSVKAKIDELTEWTYI